MFQLAGFLSKLITENDLKGSFPGPQLSTQKDGLTWEAALWDFGDVEEEGGPSDQVHDDDTRQEELHKRRKVEGLDIAQVQKQLSELTWTTSEVKPPLSQTQ